MDTPHTRSLRGNNLPEVNITDHNVQTKLKVQEGFVRKVVVLHQSLALDE